MAYNQGGYNRGGYQNNRGGYQPRVEVPKKLPEGYLEGGYFERKDGKSVLKRDYILGYPTQIAELMVERDRNMNKSSQIRKYYDYCIRIRDMLHAGKDFGEVEAEFCRLSNFVAYAESRNLVSRLFVRFIDRNIEAVHGKEDFFAFVKHFEAVVAHLKDK